MVGSKKKRVLPTALTACRSPKERSTPRIGAGSHNLPRLQLSRAHSARAVAPSKHRGLDSLGAIASGITHADASNSLFETATLGRRGGDESRSYSRAEGSTTLCVDSSLASGPADLDWAPCE